MGRLTANRPTARKKRPFRKSNLSAAIRTTGLNNAPGRIVWLTGLSGAGKTTLAKELQQRLSEMGERVFVLDGDVLRMGLCSDLGFSAVDRKENIRRAGEVAKLFVEAGCICITAFISPYREDRDWARTLVQKGRFMEVFVNASLEVCERRDPKGLYRKARNGLLKEFTGVSAPYERPLKPELELRTDQASVEECAARLLAAVKASI